MAELGFIAADSAQELRPPASIKRVATAVTAFVGRTLKGPVNQPISIASFNDYQRVFGGLWQPSPLSYAVEQYFRMAAAKRSWFASAMAVILPRCDCRRVQRT